MSARIVDCGEDMVFNARSERCVPIDGTLGQLMLAIERGLDSKRGEGYFSLGCPEGTIKNPRTGYCIDEETELGETIRVNIDRRLHGVIECTPPLVFDDESKRCVAPSSRGSPSCDAYPERPEDYEFVPHEEQAEIADWFVHRSTHRGIVLFHELGSGKTCTTIMIIDAWLGLHPGRKVFVYLPASLRQNFIREYCVQCGKNPDDIGDRIAFVSYNYTSNQRHLPTSEMLRGNLVVIDEFHRVVLGMINEGVHYPAVYNSICDSEADKIVCLTGTAISSSPLEIYYAVKLCRIDNPFVSGANYLDNVMRFDTDNGTFVPQNRDEFVRIVGSVYSFLAPLATAQGAMGYPSVSNTSIFVPMVKRQYDEYIEIRGNEIQAAGQYPELDDPDYLQKRIRFFLAVSMVRSRQVSNMIYLNPVPKHLRDYSPKFAAIVRNVLDTPGKNVIYSQFKTDYGVDFLNQVLRAKGVSTMEFTGDNNDAQRADILARWNAHSNRFGDEYKCLLVTEAGALGLNLLAVRKLHIVEQSISPSLMAQIKGRVVRFGSHAMLPPKQRTVQIVSYYSTSPSVDIPTNTPVESIPVPLRTSDMIAYVMAQRKTKSVAPELEILKGLPLVPQSA